jgi:hypothetical protein
MTSMWKVVCATGVWLALSLIITPLAYAKSHIQVLNTRSSVNALRVSATSHHGGSEITQAIVSQEKFVNRLLKEEDLAISRNVTLLTKRQTTTNRLTYLDSLVPTNPQQARLIAAAIQHNTAYLGTIQGRLDMNRIHLITTIPGIDSAISASLSRLSIFAVESEQIARFIAVSTVRQETNYATLQKIVDVIPASP